MPVSVLLCAAGGAYYWNLPAPKTVESPSVVSLPRQVVPTRTDIRFVDKTATSGVEFVYHNDHESNHHAILESLGGGLGLFDYDGDGRWDLFCPGGGRYGKGTELRGLPSGLFRNLGSWRFEDVTPGARAGQAPYFTHGCSAADFNSDGFTDVVLTGYGGLQLFQNQGDGTFLEVREQAGLHDTLWSSSAAWGDLNGDSHLDLYVCHYVDWSLEPEHNPTCPGPTPETPEICSPRNFQPLPHVVYYGNGDGTFRDATSEARLKVTPGMCGKGLGVVLADFDLDGDLDIYVANDTVSNFLYVNNYNGCGLGVFEEVGVLHGVARDPVGKENGSMGTDVGDYNGDGLPDIFVAEFEQESFSLYRNDGDAQFTHVSQLTGITALGTLFVGFGTSFADLDRDGDEDVLVSDGHVINFPRVAPIRQEPLALLNEKGRYVRASFPAGEDYFGTPHRGRGLAAGDLDDDGDLDVVFSHNDNEPNAIVSNETPNDNSWLRVHLIGTVSNRSAIGARLVLHTTAGDQLRLIKGGGSYESQNDLRAWWGIPQGAEITGLTIRWPSGLVQKVSALQPNETLVVVEPSTTDASLREQEGNPQTTQISQIEEGVMASSN